MTFVFYEIAGEEITALVNIKAHEEIAHADGLIVLQAPIHFPIYGGTPGVDNALLRSINNLFVGSDYCSIPIDTINRYRQKYDESYLCGVHLYE